MRLVHVAIHSALVAALLTMLPSTTPLRATGYWNVPSSFCQCWGCGWGAGYHAPFVLGPISWETLCTHNEVRLPHAPPPPCYGYNHCGSSVGPAAPMAPAVVQSAVIESAPPASAPTRAIFDPPVEP